MQLPTVLSTPTSNTGGGLLSPASGRSWPVWSIQASPPCHQMLLRQRMWLCHQGLMPDDATVNHGSARRAVISDSGVRPASRSGTVIADNKDKKDKTSNADRQPGSASDKPSSDCRGKFACKSCGRGFAHASSLSRHKAAVHEQQQTSLFQCTICHKDFKRKDGLKRHETASHSGPEGKFACKSCGRSFAHASSLNRHKAAKHEQQQTSLFQCTICHKNFSRNYGLKRHETAWHSGRREGFACIVCSQSLPTKFELRQHCDTHHGKAKEFPCLFCDKVFAKSYNLIQHGKCHFFNVRSGEGFRCGICDRVFCYKQNLKDHQKVHDEGRTRRCDECGADFVGKVMLAHHRITCHGKGKFHSCMLCDSKLASKRSLKNHYVGRHGVVESAIASSKTNACKDANMHVNTDAECKEITACSKAEKRKTCSKSEVESTCSGSETESTCGESEKGIICNEHAKEMPEDLKDHRHFPGKMTSRWTALFSASQQ